MKDRKTKEIQKERFIRRRDDRPYQSHSHHVPVHKKTYQEVKEIDRAETCPFLVRVFYAINDENNYKGKSAEELHVEREIKLHLWMNSTLKEITELIRAILPNVRSKQKFTFYKLTFNKEKKEFQKEELGWIFPSKRYLKSEEKQLSQTKFKIGDMLDISITYK